MYTLAFKLISPLLMFSQYSLQGNSYELIVCSDKQNVYNIGLNECQFKLKNDS